MTNVYVAGYRHPLLIANVRDARRALGRARDPRCRRRALRRRVRRARCPFRERGARTDEAIDGIGGAGRDPPTTGDPGLQRPRATTPTGATATSADLDRWIRPSPRCAASRHGRRLDPAGHAAQATAGRHRVHPRHRDEVRPGAAPDIGFITETVYVGEPDWNRPYSVVGFARAADRHFNALGAIGVNHLQLVRAPFRVRALRPGRRVRRRGRPAPHPRRALEQVPVPILTMRHDFRAPEFGPASTPRHLHRRARAVAVGRHARLRHAVSRSITASTTVGCRRRSRWPRACSR